MMINLLETAGKLCGHRCRGRNLREEGSVSSDDHKEQEKEELEEEEVITASKLPLESQSSSSNYKEFFTSNSIESQQEIDEIQQHSLLSLNFHNKQDLIGFSLSNNKGSTDNDRKKAVDVGSNCEKEHMFDKVVTPSDVGKLNRLVIPKQHAEKYFPLDTSSNEKGLLLNFEDRNGKQWKFRYSYWNSSQSYVMTKGWSRFVKEKKLIAGDTVTFQRGVGESGQQVLFIDWRHRPDTTFPANYPSPFMQFGFQNYHQSLRFGKIFVPQFRNLSYATTSIFQQQQQPCHHNQGNSYQYHGNFGGRYNLMRPIGTHQIGEEHDNHLPIVIDPMPIVHGTSVGKRLRLFGVNMECGSTQEDDDQTQYSSSPTAIPCPHDLASSSITSASPIQSTVLMPPPEVSKKAKTSLSFDLDL